MTKQHVSVVLGIAMIAITTALVQPAFLSLGNLSNISVQATIPGVVALGMAFVVISGGIDLSVGATVALASMVLGSLAQAGVSPWLAAVACLAAGGLVGLANGLLVNQAGLAPFLATLGTMGIARGGAFLLSGGEPISGVTGSLRLLYDTQSSAVTLSVLVLVASAAAGAVVLRFTVWGRRLYAVGSNERAALLAGINVKKQRTVAYIVSGVAAAAGGALITARLDSAQPLAGSLYELDAIAAVVIGGGSLLGGRGDILGTLLGVLLVLELRNSVTIIGLPPHAQPLVVGAVLLLAVAIDRRRTKATSKGRPQ